MSQLKEIIKIKVTDISDMGQGIGRIDGIVVFVTGAIPGDVVEVEVTEKKKKYWKARVANILEQSPHAVEPACAFSAECGGCGMMNTGYSEQLRIKERHLTEKLERIAGVKAEVQPMIGMDKPYFYRNKTEFTVSKGGRIGFNKQGSHEVVDIAQCLLSSPVANTILDCVRTFTGGSGASRPFGISKITVRTSYSTGETMVIFESETKDVDDFFPLIERLDDAVNNMDAEIDCSLESVYVCNSNKKKDQYKLVAGNRTINDEMMGLKFEISPESFYQVNSVQAAELFKKVGEYAGLTGSENVFDLYCGVGSIGLTLAGSAQEVWGVEVVKSAILDANRNAVINGIINARYIQGKAEEVMREGSSLGKSGFHIDENSVILLDPPRAGCKPKVLESIGAGKAGKIVYVSCDPATFARDVKILSEIGFVLEKITPVDMFPQTVHTETVALFRRLSEI
jgi:23S rRNA (uracil1939-C5)-methyltransferase